MESADAMVVWTPNRAPFLENATRGRVAVTGIPEDPETKGFTHSVGVCDRGWREKSEAERQKALHRLADQMIKRDNILSGDLEEAFDQIEGWPGIGNAPFDKPSRGESGT
ncbi:hypothetical protein [Mesorhizobium sp. B1-1-5]|uniref:hypothetical protein n=1 Tax=Mesorhizobium sp. B1-1-5 TaxID=2589979 RepID=UPI001129F8C0|nr:hypothetical protein [Mesorhizobium sp. B1-1-5]TPO05154.1 hypothetical protein FJ980_14870 [Mesorhizobium sp. B1-1-5]